MSNRSRLVFAAAMGILAVLASATHLRTREQQLLGAAAPSAVCTAAKDILGNTVIEEMDLLRAEVPSEFLQPLAVTDCKEAYGHVAAVAIPAGAQIPGTALLDRRSSGLASLVPRSHRAVSIAVDGVTSVGGLVRPGNVVDVFVTVVFAQAAGRESNSADERTEVRLLIERVPIIAVGQKLLGQGEGNEAPPRTLGDREAAPDAPQNPEARTVTVSVTPEQVAKLVLAQQVGKLTLALRANVDTSSVPVDPLDPLTLFKVPMPIKPRGQAFTEYHGATF